ncbi:hypothetical protein SEA_LILMAC1015_54 [Arthrobacter phage Lilmac1015]|uniref:Uncharacterized protein n=1 Tax=Arthrobacter phage Lilmac1015 TaxID=2912653 RepID=A0AA49GZH7_9CAUD|nr:hypothetical protein SEA_LILMAC1015_54 [Arthrobacter phage Lilmac1015]
MNFTRQQTNAGLLYVGTETDGVNFEIAKTKAGQYELTAGGEIAGTFKLLKDAKIAANRIESEILDAMVLRSKAEIEARGIVPGALVEVKGRRASEGPVTVKHVGAGYVELNRPNGGTFRRPASDLTVVLPAEPIEFTAEELDRVSADIDAHNARAAELHRPELSVHIGDEVELADRPGHVIVTGIHGDGTATVRPEGGVKFVVKGSDIVAIRRTREEIEEAATARAVGAEYTKAGSIVAGEERIQTAGGVSIGDRAEISGDDSVWTVNQIIEVEGEYLYRLRDETRPAGFRSTWRLGEEITLVSDDEAEEAAVDTEFSEEEVAAERHENAVGFRYEARQWPTGRDVVPNTIETAAQFRTEAALTRARAEAEALKPGDTVAYNGSRGMEGWTVIGRRDQGGFVTLHLRELSGTTSWMTIAELASAVVDGRALLIRTAGGSDTPDERGILDVLGVAVETWVAETDGAPVETALEDRAGQPVLHLGYSGGSYEIYATRVG